jgi:hypothetical protein
MREDILRCLIYSSISNDNKDALISILFGKGRNLISSSYEYLSLLVYTFIIIGGNAKGKLLEKVV